MTDELLREDYIFFFLFIKISSFPTVCRTRVMHSLTNSNIHVCIYNLVMIHVLVYTGWCRVGLPGAWLQV